MKTQEKYASVKMTEIPYNVYTPMIRFRYYGIIQIIHPFGEHIERYDHFARYLCNKGFVVIVSEILGHDGALFQNELGYFDKKYGWESLIQDLDRLRSMIHPRYADLPYFMLSIGSANVLLQSYLMQYGDYVQGALMIGMFHRGDNLTFKSLLLQADILIFGNKHHSELLDRMVFGHVRQVRHYNYKKMKWLSHDEKVIKDYIEDSKLGFVFTTTALKEIVTGMKQFNTVSKKSKLYNSCPLLLLNGNDDPIGGGDSYARFLGKLYRSAGIEDVQYFTYPNTKHDMLHDLNWEEIYDDIWMWLYDHTYR